MIENTDADQIERLNSRIIELLRERDALVKALEECAIRCRYDGDLFHDQGNEMRRDASWRAADLANATLASIKDESA